MKQKTKIIGENFLHSHPKLEYKLNLDEEYVIVDREDLEKVIRFFEENPTFIDYLNK